MIFQRNDFELPRIPNGRSSPDDTILNDLRDFFEASLMQLVLEGDRGEPTAEKGPSINQITDPQQLGYLKQKRDFTRYLAYLYSFEKSGNWVTALALAYSKDTKKILYCFALNLKTIQITISVADTHNI